MSRTATGVVMALALTGTAVAWVGCAPAATGPPGTAPRQPPDLVLITLDTVRADRLGAYGWAAPTSPSIDALAARGLLFENCDSASPLTLPSHATLLTGLLPPDHGLRRNGHGRLAAGVETLAEALAGHGYRTGAFVSSVILDRVHGLDRGFQTYDDEIDAGRVERAGAATVERALRWWLADPAPSFLWIHLYEPHAPYAPRGRGRQSPTPYEGEIADADALVGSLLQAGRESGRPAPLVALVADHGEGLGEHGEAEHGLLLFQSTLAVPLILAGPGIPVSRRADPVRTLDLMPTLLAALGQPPAADDSHCGRNLLAQAGDVDGGGAAADVGPCGAGTYAETLMPLDDHGWSPLFAYREGRWKVMQGSRTSFYDLEGDTGELRPQASTVGSADLLSHMQKARAGAGRLVARPSGAAAAAGSGASTPAEELWLLGYLGGGPTQDAGGRAARADPRDRIGFHQQVRRVLDLYHSGEMESAATQLGALLLQEPSSPVLLDLSGSIELALDRPQAAVDLYLQALSLRPERGPAELRLAEAYLAAGDHASAESWARKALSHLRRDPGDRPALVLALALAGLGRIHEAAAIATERLAVGAHSGNETIRAQLRRLAAGD